MFLVVDNEFNRANYPDLVGKTFEKAPPYAHVVYKEEIFEPAKAEKYFRDQKEKDKTKFDDIKEKQ